MRAAAPPMRLRTSRIRRSWTRVAAEAVRAFGGIDTWVNNAGVSIYGKLTEVPMADKKRLFDVNFWGVVNGCRTAVHHMRERGGTIINIGSIVSDQAVPLQGIYSASKHAVQGYTNALRMELEHDKLPIAVSLVKPSAIDTPYLEHARNYMEAAPSFPPPVYAPEVVATTILKCAERPVRDVTVGGGGRMMTHARCDGAAHDRQVHGKHDVLAAEGSRGAQPDDGQPLQSEARWTADRALRWPRDAVECLHAREDVAGDAGAAVARCRGGVRRRRAPDPDLASWARQVQIS